MFPTSILLATDGSEEAAEATRMATELAEKTGSELHLVYVESLPHPYSLSEATIYSTRRRATRCARRRFGRLKRS